MEVLGLSCAEGHPQASRRPKNYEGSKGIESLLSFLLPHVRASSLEREKKKTSRVFGLVHLRKVSADQMKCSKKKNLR